MEKNPTCKEQKTKDVKLVKVSNQYQIIIPSKVENKIRHLCSKISEVEWSGTLFYTTKGSMKNNDLVITCEDIYIMDIGSAEYTEFDVDPNIISYMCDKPELLDCQVGLIHSHAALPTFFSGTDLNTLLSEGNKRNHFVSLIVNNAGNYTAAITRSIKAVRRITEDIIYNTFGDTEEKEQSSFTEESTEIQYNYLEIVKETTTDNFNDIDARIEEIKSNKQTNTRERWKRDIGNETSVPSVRYNRSLFDDEDDIFKDSPLYNTSCPWYEEQNKASTDSFSKNLMSDFISKETLDSYLLQLLSGTILITPDTNITVEQCLKSMEKLFDARFKGDIKLYEVWAEYTCELLCMYPTGESAYILDESDYCEYVAQELINRLNKLPKSNKYIEVLIKTLSYYGCDK